MKLSESQERCFNAFKDGQSLVITGPAGCGKSHMVNNIKEWCESRGKSVALTALTGAAAHIIGGCTLHHWGGLGLARGDPNLIVTKMSPRARRRWRETVVLVIDEVSMMSSDMFDKVHTVACRVRKCDSSLFGGLQTVFIGDFAQLAPIGARGERTKYAFESPVWSRYLPNRTFYLREVFRQSDTKFVDLLSRVRLGCLTNEDKDLIDSRIIKDASEVTVRTANGSDIKPTYLYPTKALAEALNKREIAKLVKAGETTVTFSASDRVLSGCDEMCDYPHTHITTMREISLLERHSDSLCKYTSALRELTICEGAQVMLTRNISDEDGLFNGVRGIVHGINVEDSVVFVEFECGLLGSVGKEDFRYRTRTSELCIRSQIPLIMAWAITIHKSQGATIPKAVIDVRSAFTPSQVYVALSRVSSLSDLHITGAIDYGKVVPNDRVRRYYESLESLESLESMESLESPSRSLSEDSSSEEICVTKDVTGPTKEFDDPSLVTPV